MALVADPAAALSLNPDPASPGIKDANTLHTIMFIVIVIGILVVNLAILRAVRPRHRAVETGDAPSRGNGPFAIGLSVVAIALFVVATIFSSASRDVPESRAEVAGVDGSRQLRIIATGQQWLWRYTYPNGAFGYHRLVVPEGVTVALELKSSDVIHGWNVPALTGKAQAVPGKTNTVYFRADEVGIHSGRASVLSGQGYDSMQSLVEVVGRQDWEDYVKTLKTDIQSAQDTVERQQAAEARKAMNQ